MPMKNKRKLPRAAALACAALLALGLAACGGSGASADSMAATAPAGRSEQWSSDNALDSGAETGSAEGTALGEILPATAESSRKIIYNASLSMETQDFPAAQQALTAAVSAAGGYLESSDSSGSAEGRNRYANYTARIPADNYRSFLQAAGQAASVTSQNENAQDITSSYIDVEARLTALNAQRDRLNALADEAETTADLLEIESQLSDVQYQIESYTQQLRAMDDQIGYSTVDIYLSEVSTLTPTDSSFGARLRDAFSGGWAGFYAAVQGLVLLLVYLLPLLLLIALVVLVVWLIVRAGHRRHPPKPKPPKGGPGQPYAYQPSQTPAPGTTPVDEEKK